MINAFARLIKKNNDLKVFVFFSTQSKVKLRTDMNIPGLELRNLEFTYTQSVNLPEIKLKISIIFTFGFIYLRGRHIVLLAFSDIIFSTGRNRKSSVPDSSDCYTDNTDLGWKAGRSPLQGEFKGTQN